jgi:hypothetical protein
VLDPEITEGGYMQHVTTDDKVILSKCILKDKYIFLSQHVTKQLWSYLAKHYKQLASGLVVEVLTCV